MESFFLSYNHMFFCLETKEPKIQGCDKKAKKRLRSTKVVKLAQKSKFTAKYLFQKYLRSS